MEILMRIRNIYWVILFVLLLEPNFIFAQCTPDIVPPTIVFNNNLTKNLSSSGSVTLTISEVENGSTDNCSASATLVKKITYGSQTNVNSINFNCSDLGLKNITYSVTDGAGNSSSVTVKVTVVDNIAPAINFNNNITKNLSSTGSISLSVSDVENGSSDNCTASGSLSKKLTFGTQINANTINFSCTDIGMQNVTYTVTDANGNSNSVTVKVTIADNLGPTIIYNNNLTKNLSSAGTVTLTISEVENGSTDNCSTSAVLVKKLSFGTQTNVNAINFSCTDIGSQNVTYTLTDAIGNTSSVIVKVIVTDNIAPTISFNNNLTKYLSLTGTVSLTISDVENGSVDNCTSNGNLTKKLSYGSQTNVNIVNFSCADIGAHNVTYTLTDAAGNMSNVTVKVTIGDNLVPVINYNNNVKKYLNDQGAATLLIADIENGSTDNCTNSNSLTKQLNYSSQTNANSINFNCSDLGNKSTTYKVTDASGNITSQLVTIIVLDTTSPTINSNTNITKYLNSSGIASVTVNEIENGSTDNCTSSASLTKGLSFKASQNQNTIYFNCTDRGNKVIYFKVIDASGNFKIKSVTINVLDTFRPKLITKNPISFYSNNGNIFSITRNIVDSASVDNCNIDFTFTPAYLSGSNLGSNLIYVKGVDSSGNSVWTYSSIDLRDTTRPKIINRNTINLYLNNYGVAQLAAESMFGIGQDSNLIISIFDNCDKNPTISLSKTNYSIGDVFSSPQKVKLSVIDKSGNINVKFINVIIRDTITPKLKIKKALTFKLNSNGVLKITPNDLDSGSSDNSNYFNLEIDKSVFNCDDLGENTITFKAIDKAGNISSQLVKIMIVPLNSYGTIYSKINLSKSILCKDLKTGELNLDILGGTEPYNIVWRKDNSTVTLLNNKLNANNLGAGFYTVTIKDVSNCIKTDSILLTEPSIYLPIISKSNDTTICAGKSLRIYATGGESYVWNNENFLDYKSVSTPIATPSKSSTFKVKVTDNNGCINYDSVRINIRSLPTIKIQNTSAEVCLFNQLDLSATGGVNYTWHPVNAFNNHKLSAVKTKIFASTTIHVNGIDNYGCENIDSLSIVVHSLPKLITTSSDSICSGSSKQLISSGAFNYIWTGSNLSSITISNPIATPIKTTKYIVEGISAKGCKSKDSTIIYVKNNPTPSSIAGVETICQNANWLEYSVFNNAALIREWSIVNGNINFKTNNSVYVNWNNGLAGSIQLTETSTQYPFCVSKSIKNINFTKAIAKSPTQIFVKGNNVSSNILISNLQNYPFMIWGYESKADYKEIITCQNSNWCKFDYIDTFRNRYWVKIGDSTSCLQKSYLNSPSYLNSHIVEKDEFVVYPNPSSNFIQITNSDAIENVYVVSSIGETLLKTRNGTIDLTNLSSGTYFVEIFNRKGLKTVRKISILK
jgi:hypothetical protein